MEKLYDTAGILKTHGNDQEFLKYIAALFVEHAPEMSAELQKASRKKDWENLHFYAHKMKATIDLFCITSLTDVIRNLEKQGRAATNSNTLKEDVNYVVKIIDACVVQLKKDFAIAR